MRNFYLISPAHSKHINKPHKPTSRTKALKKSLLFPTHDFNIIRIDCKLSNEEVLLKNMRSIFVLHIRLSIFMI